MKMFEMKVEKQLNITDRTLLLGKTEDVIFPEYISVDGLKFKVLGRSLGVKPPFVSLEIEKTSEDLTEKTIM